MVASGWARCTGLRVGDPRLPGRRRAGQQRRARLVAGAEDFGPDRAGLGHGAAHAADALPRGRSHDPLVAVTNEQAGSDSDIVTAMIRQLGLGPVVRTRTWGGVIGIDMRYKLVDGTVVTQPRYSRSGSPTPAGAGELRRRPRRRSTVHRTPGQPAATHGSTLPWPSRSSGWPSTRRPRRRTPPTGRTAAPRCQPATDGLPRRGARHGQQVPLDSLRSSAGTSLVPPQRRGRGCGGVRAAASVALH